MFALSLGHYFVLGMHMNNQIKPLHSVAPLGIPMEKFYDDQGRLITHSFMLDDDSTALPDGHWEPVIRMWLNEGGVICVGNALALLCARHLLFQMPVEQRPIICWDIHGVAAHFDDDMRSTDAWGHPHIDLYDQYLETLLAKP